MASLTDNLVCLDPCPYSSLVFSMLQSSILQVSTKAFKLSDSAETLDQVSEELEI